MSQANRFVVFAALLFVALAPDAFAITSVKTVSLLHNNNASPFFTKAADGAGLDFTSPSDAGGTFTPVGAPQAGQVTSITTRGVFSIVGNSTSAGGWTNNNGVPKGITLTFNADITFSVGAGAPAGSFLTLSQNGANRGDGLGITQFQGGTSTLESFNLNEVPNTVPLDPNDTNETLAVSAVTVSDVAFSGTLEETGFTFSPGTVGNFGPYYLRSPGFADTAETSALVSANNSVDPQGQGRPTIGFGVPGPDPSENGRGQGFVQSNTLIRNSNNLQTLGTRTNYFPRQPGAFTYTMLNGTMAFKGIGYEYDVNFNIAPIPPTLTGDYNANGVVDAADYVLWRKGDLAADSNGDTFVDQVDYDAWRANFGNGSTPGLGAASAVPEPTACTLLALAALLVPALGATRRSR